MDRTKVLCFIVMSLLLSPSKADENCQLSENELSKISDVLTHMDKPIYAEETFDSANSECTDMLNGIHMQLRRLTQRYKLMNKGYMKLEEFNKMAREYDDQLKKLNGELENFQKNAQSSGNEKLLQLKGNIVQLEQNVTKLHHELKGISAEYAKVQMDLCVTYLESKQMSKARAKVNKLEPRLLMEVVHKFLNTSKSNLLPVIDICLEIPDLDDRGEAYKTIFDFIETNNRMDSDDLISLEAEVLKMNATLNPSSKITDIRREEVQKLLFSMLWNSVFQKWAMYIKKNEKFLVIKNTLDRMVLVQMEHFVNTIVAINGFDTGRDLLKLFALSNNYNKIAAYRKLTKKKIGRVLALILLDMQSMERTELKYDPLVPEAIKQLYNDTFNFFPKSLKDIRSCLNNVNIYQGSPNSKQCIVATNNQVEVKHPKFGNTLGHMKQVILNSTGCTSFRLELVNDMASVKIINAEGNALTNINAAVPGMTDFSFVGAPYTNSANMKLDSSQLWILDVSYKSDMIKIESEFNVYRTGQAWKSMDYLVYRNINGVNQPVVARWGMEGMLVSRVKNYAEWTFKCAS